MSIEAIKQMVHELEYVLDCINNDEIPFDGDDFHEALRLGRQAIAEAEKQEPDDLTIAYMSGFHAGKNTPQRKPEQEPVAWMVYTQDGQSVYVTDNPTDIQELQQSLPLYTTPPQREWVGLTDEQYQNCAQAMDAEPLVEGWIELIKFAKSIEAKLREKNSC